MGKTIDMNSYRTGKITRERDGLVKSGKIGFVEWGGENEFLAVHPEPKIGYSIMVDFHRFEFTWLTTKITEIVDDTTFKTKNSVYKLEYDEQSS